MVSGCQLLPENAQLKSYRVLVQQGNVIDESKVDSLKVKMTREQVAFLLGEPVLNNISIRIDGIMYIIEKEILKKHN